MKKIYINKKYFNMLLHRRYASYITDGKVTRGRLLLMLSTEVECSIRSLYNFINNKYSLNLLEKIIEALHITEDEFKKLIIL